MEHPITPPPWLVGQWITNAVGPDYEQCIATQAARWGADQELEACEKWLDFYSAASTARGLRAARRPKPPSLKKQALAALKHLELIPDPPGFIADMDTIRRALEQLND